MAVLLVLLIGTVFLLPAAVPEGTQWWVILDVMTALILFTGVVAVADHPRFARVLFALSFVVVALLALEFAAPAALTPFLRRLSILIALVVLAAAVGINVFGQAHAIGDRILGAIVLYLLIGLACALVYAYIDRIVPGAFSKRASDGAAIGDWVYFSFVTLTTVGFGDVTPVARAARAIAIGEALVGQLYPAIVIARLISLRDQRE
jgi:hypothetical protein